MNKYFSGLIEALDQLEDVLTLGNMPKEDSVFLAISPLGLVVAEHLCKKYNCPLEFLFTESVFSPINPECQIASVSETMKIVINEQLIDSFDISLDYVYGEAKRKYEENILKDVHRFRKGGSISSLKDKNVIIVDYGIDTGFTTSVAIDTSLSQGAKSVCVATPVISDDVATELSRICDNVYCVIRPKYFVEKSYYYDNIPEAQKENIDDILEKTTKEMV